MLVHDRATPLARRRTPEGFLEMRARIGRAGLQDDRARRFATSDLVGELRATIEVRDQEIRMLKARAIFEATNLGPSVDLRRRTIEAARGMCGPGFDAPELDVEGIRCVAVAAVLGPEAVRNRGDAFVAAAFDTLAALPLAGRSDPNLSLIALRARNAALSDAWKPEATKSTSPTVAFATSRLDADPEGYLTQPRDDDGRWTIGNGSSAAAGSDVGASSSAEASLVGRSKSSVSVPGYTRNLKQNEAVRPAIAGSSSSIAACFARKIQIAYPGGWQACHEECLKETEHIRAPDRVLVYRRCVRECLGPDADY